MVVSSACILIYKSGPKTEPCGTPRLMSWGSDKLTAFYDYIPVTHKGGVPIINFIR